MPMLPKRGCCEPMCGAVAAPDSSRCPAHARAEQRALEAGRPSTTERGYGGPWQRVRPLVFARDGWRCCRCGWQPPYADECRRFGLPVDVDRQLELLAAAHQAGERHLVADHVVPVRRFDPNTHYAMENLQTLCSTCHNRKSQGE
jgi:5-methylcytosine-specific restriction endonuclease McrA